MQNLLTTDAAQSKWLAVNVMMPTTRAKAALPWPHCFVDDLANPVQEIRVPLEHGLYQARYSALRGIASGRPMRTPNLHSRRSCWDNGLPSRALGRRLGRRSRFRLYVLEEPSFPAMQRL